jgi:hypothetical protein
MPRLPLHSAAHRSRDIDCSNMALLTIPWNSRHRARTEKSQTRKCQMAVVRYGTLDIPVFGTLMPTPVWYGDLCNRFRPEDCQDASGSQKSGYVIGKTVL